jgi:hypothetical protein
MEVRGIRRKLHNEELHNLYIIMTTNSRSEVGGARGTYGREDKCILIFGWRESKGKRPLRRPRHGWEDNIVTY